MATKWHTCIRRSKRQTSNGHAYQYKQRNDKTVHACIPRSERQTINGDVCSNASRWKTKLRVHGYLILSIKRAMETIFKHEQTKNKPTRAHIPHSKRQTSNGDACKLKQTKKQSHTCIYLVLSIRRAMETLVNSSRRKTKLHVHVYLVLSVRRVIHTPEAASSTGLSKAKWARILTREEGSRASAEREWGDWKRARSASGGWWEGKILRSRLSPRPRFPQ